MAFARIEIKHRSTARAGNDEIDSAVVIDVGEHDAGGCALAAQACFRCPVGECPIAVVAPEHVAARRLRRARLAGNEQIEIAVVIEINKRQTGRTIDRHNAGGLGYIGELAAPEIAKQQHAVTECHGQIVPAIIVEIADRTRNAGATCVETCLLGRKLLPVTIPDIVVHADGVLSVTHHHQIEMAIAGYIQHADATTCVASSCLG